MIAYRFWSSRFQASVIGEMARFYPEIHVSHPTLAGDAWQIDRCHRPFMHNISNCGSCSSFCMLTSSAANTSMAPSIPVRGPSQSSSFGLFGGTNIVCLYPLCEEFFSTWPQWALKFSFGEWYNDYYYRESWRNRARWNPKGTKNLSLDGKDRIHCWTCTVYCILRWRRRCLQADISSNSGVSARTR